MRTLTVLRPVLWCLALAGFLPSASSAIEIIDFAHHGGHTYYLLTSSTWAEAQSAAMRLGGDLVTIDDAAENDFVFQRFDSLAVSRAGGGTPSLWIGLSDHQNEGSFVWSDGSGSTYRNWKGGQPEGTYSDQDYVGILANGPDAGKWHDIVADGRLGDICFGVVEVDEFEILTVNPPAGMISWWPGENAAWDVVGQAGGSMKNAALGGQGAYDTGKVGRAFAFDGVNDHVQAPDAPGLDLPGDFTIEGWIRHSGATGERTLVSKRSGDNLDVSYTLFLRNGVLHFSSRSAGGAFNEVGGGPALPPNQWIHVAITLQGTFLTFYINGIAENFANYTATRPDTTGPMTIGGTVTDAAPTATPDGPLAGSIDELTLYNRALSGAEIDTIYWVGQGGKDRFDPVRSFQTSSNPNFPWSFGWLQAGTIQPDFLTDADPGNGAFYPAPALNQGLLNRYQPSGSSHPAVLANTSYDFSDELGAGGTWIRYSPRQLGWEPGPTGQYSVVRWTAEFAGRYALSMTATGADEQPTSTEVFLYRNNDRIFPALVVPPDLPEANLVNSFRGDGISVTRQLDLAAGDTIHWVLGWAGDFTYDNTAVVLSAALLEGEEETIQDPTWQSPVTTADPPMTGRNWRFQARNDSGADHAGMTAKIQYSANPGDPDSWVDLPGGNMTRQGDVTFLLDISDLPVGSFAFRIATTVAGIGTTYSEASQVYHIGAAAPHYEVELFASSYSNPSGATTHRSDYLTYTLRFRNTGALAGGVARARIRFPDNTVTQRPAYVTPIELSSRPSPAIGFAYRTTPGGKKVNAGDHFVWEWPMGAITPITKIQSASVRNVRQWVNGKVVTKTLFSAPQAPGGRHGYGNNEALQFRTTGALPAGISANAIYYVVNATAYNFQLSRSLGGPPVTVTNYGRGVHEYRVAEWQTRRVTFQIFDPTFSQEQAQAAANLPPINAIGATLVSRGRLMRGTTGASELDGDDSSPTTIVNPIRLTVSRVLGAGSVAQGGLVYFDLTVKNEAYRRLSGTTVVARVPAGLALVGAVFIGTDGQPGGPPIDPATNRQVVKPASWGGNNPWLTEAVVPGGQPDAIPNYEQQARFYFGDLLPQTSRKVRITCRVQYDWDVDSNPTITYQNATASGRLITRWPLPVLPGKTYYTRALENSVVLDVTEAAPGSARPSLSLWMTQEGSGLLPGDSSVAAVASVAGLSTIPQVPGSSPQRGINEIVYRVNYANFGNARAENVRLWIPLPPNIDYDKLTEIRWRYKIVNNRYVYDRLGRRVKEPYVYEIPNSFKNARILQAGADTGVKPVPVVVGEEGQRWLTCIVPYAEAFPTPGFAKTLEFRVKLKPGLALGTRIEQTGALVTTRDLFKWTHSAKANSAAPGASPNLIAEVVRPGRLTYSYDQFSKVDLDQDGNPTGQNVVVQRFLYENSSPVAVGGAGIRWEIPPGFTYYDARFVNAKGTNIRRTGITRPNPGEVLFSIGTVGGNTAGIAELLLHPDPDNLPDEDNEPNPLNRYQSTGRVTFFDNLHPEPSNLAALSNSTKEGEEVAKFNIPPLNAPLRGLLPLAPRPWVFVISPPPARENEEVTYRVLIGNTSSYATPDLSSGGINFFLRVPLGTEYVRSEVVREDGCGITEIDLFVEPGTTQFGDIAGMENPAGIVGHVVTSLSPHGVAILDFTVRVKPGWERDLHMLGPVLIIPGAAPCTASVKDTAVINDSMTTDEIRERVFAAQMGQAGSRAVGTANDLESSFVAARNEISELSIGMAIGGADVVTIPRHNLVLIPLGGGRMVAAGGGNLIGEDSTSVIGQNGGNLVSAGAGNIVAAGAGNLITIDVPGHGRKTGAEYFSQLPQMVAAGAGNIVAAGGLNLVRQTQSKSPITDAGGKLIGLDGGSLIGLDGGSLATIVQDIDTNKTGFILPDQTFLGITIRPDGIVAAGAGNLVGNSGNTLVGNSGNTIFFAEGGKVLASDALNLIRADELVDQNIGEVIVTGNGNVLPTGAGNVLPSGAGRMVAAGAGNIVAAGAGNIITVSSGMVAAGAGN